MNSRDVGCVPRKQGNFEFSRGHTAILDGQNPQIDQNPTNLTKMDFVKFLAFLYRICDFRHVSNCSFIVLELQVTYILDLPMGYIHLYDCVHFSRSIALNNSNIVMC